MQISWIRREDNQVTVREILRLLGIVIFVINGMRHWTFILGSNSFVKASDLVTVSPEQTRKVLILWHHIDVFMTKDSTKKHELVLCAGETMNPIVDPNRRLILMLDYLQIRYPSLT